MVSDPENAVGRAKATGPKPHRRTVPRHAEEADEVRVGWKMAGLGFQVATEVGAGALVGWLADRWLGTEPVGILVGSLAGIAVALWSLLKGTLKLNRELDRRVAARHRATHDTTPPGPGTSNAAGFDDQWDDNDDDKW